MKGCVQATSHATSKGPRPKKGFVKLERRDLRDINLQFRLLERCDSEIEIAISSFVYSSAATSAIAISAESAKDVEELAESPPRLRTSAVLSAPASANASLATSAARQSAAALIGMRFPTLVRSVLSLRKRVPVGSVAPW